VSRLASLQEIAARVPSGAYIAVGGFQLNRAPMALLGALVEAGVDALHVVSAPNALALDFLASHGRLRTVDTGFIGFQYEDGFVVAPALREAVARGVIELRQDDVYDTIRALRASANGGAATRPEATLLHAQRADRAGNLFLADPHADIVLAEAGKTVLATAEEIVDHIELPTIPAEKVAMVALCEGGAAPTSCFGFYGRDPEGIRRQIRVEPASTSAEPSTSIDRYVVFLARQVRDGEVVVTGLASALAMIAIQLARRTHAPSMRYINCVGAVNPGGRAALATSVDPELLAACETTITLPEIFDLARDGGVDTMFFGAAQIDREARINLSRIGPAQNPKVRLPGPAGSPSMRSYVRRVIVTVPRQTSRTLVRHIDVVTSVASERNQETVLVTDLAVWNLVDGHLEPTSLHAGVGTADLIAHTGFTFDSGPRPHTAEPTAAELDALEHIDPEGTRYRLLGSKPSYQKAPQQPEKHLHER